MSSYQDIYAKRLNRHGDNYQDRINAKRREEFERYMAKSTETIEFSFEEEIHPGILTTMRQGDSITLQYLLTRRDLILSSGTILKIENDIGIERTWMVFYLEEIAASGYNRYVVVRMTHEIAWKAHDGSEHVSPGYMYGQEDNMLKNEILGRSRMDAIYQENIKMSFIVMPTNVKIKKDVYFEIGEGELMEAYQVTGYDRQSQPGMMYVTVNPVLKRDLTPPPQPDPENPDENEDEFFWL